MNEEQIIYKGSPSLLTRFGSLFLAALIVIGSAVGAALVSPWFLILAGLALVYAFAVVAVVKATQYEVTNQRIRFRTGLLTKRTDELECYRDKDTTLIEPFPNRAFGLGTIEILTFDASTPIQRLEAIKGARELREKLRNIVEECRDRKGVRLTEFDQTQQNT
jgi:uncharacterized membrane protein YdbT with pleckstrin-like domain